MAIQSPEHRLWWKEPIERTEIIWIAVAFLWGLTMFGTMIAWTWSPIEASTAAMWR